MRTNVYRIADATNQWENWESESAEPGIKFPEDPIAISCVLYRMRIEDSYQSGNVANIFSLSNDAKLLAQSILPEDRFLAQNIRTYYNGKIVLSTLRNENLTKFRKDLTRLLATDYESGTYLVPESFTGMLYKLPYFYAYDRDLIDIFDGEYYSAVERKRGENATLTFIRKLDAFRKRLPRDEYWFLDEQDNRVLINIEKNNPLGSLFEKHITENEIEVSGFFRHKRKDNLGFYELTNWELL